MDTEYVLSYTGSEIEEKLRKVDDCIERNEIENYVKSYVEQYISEALGGDY